jgi:tetratricopeptide (TPR) repeat protein
VRRKPLKLTDYGPAPGRLDAAVEWLLAGMLAFLPLAFGAVEPWSEFVAVAAALALALLLVVRRLVRGDCPPGWTWAYVPLALFVLLALLQLAPLPESLVRTLSPATVAEKGRLLADLPAGSASASTTLSFYALATRHDLRVVLVAAAVFVAVVEVYRRPEQVRRLLLTVTCVGGLVALLALAQQATGTDQIYWLVPARRGSVADGGPFVNHNNFAQFMNLSTGAALGLLLVKLRDLGVGADLATSDVAAALREPEARPAFVYAGVVVAGMVAVFLSMSRGGMVGLLAGLALATLVLARRRHLRAQGWVVALLGLAGFGALLYLGFDAVYERLVAVRNFPEATGGRFELVRDAVGVWRKFPLLGIGLGTHAWVFPAYDRTGAAQLAQYVENDYVQALEETGALGLALVLLFAGVIWANFFRASAAQRPRVCAASTGLGFGLLAVMVHGAADFGQHVPAVAALSGVTCGLLVAMSRLAARARRAEQAAEDAPAEEEVPEAPAEESAAPPQRPAPRRRPQLAAALAPVAAAVLLAWSALDANDARVAAEHSSAANRVAAALARAGWDGSDEDFTRLLQSASDATSAEPGDVELRYWLNAYRWRALARERDEQTGDLLLTEEALGHTARIVDELHAARPLCPSYGPLVSLAGQLELFVLGRDVGREHIAASYALAPNHPDVVFTAALADAERGAWDDALSKFRRVVKLSPQTVPEVIGVLEAQYDRPDLAVAAAADGDDPGALMQLAQRLRAKGGHEAVARDAWKAGVAALERVCARSDPSPGAVAALANAYRLDGRTAEAIAAYRRALVLDYGRVEWRLELARLLDAAGRRPEALREAQICLRLWPASEEAQALVGQLVVPAAKPTSGPSAGDSASLDPAAARGATRPTAGR